MSEWIVRVEGKEYGPADLTTLREWKGEGRVIPGNQARQVDVDLWTTAAEIPDLFEKPPPPPLPPRAKKPPRQRRPPVKIFRRTLQIYGKGFSQFFCLSLLVILPSACAQLTAVFLDRFPNVEGDLRAALGAGVELCMLMLFLVVWPIYLAGIQVLTAHISAGRRLGFVNVLNEAVRFWPRMASGCVFVYLSYVFWTILPLTVMVMIASVSGASLASLFLILLVLSFQVWMTSRLFINFLFWQQCIVLDGLPAPEALRESKRVARSGHHLPWPRRPLWRGVFMASLWFAFVLIVNLWPVWPMVQHYFHELTIAQDPQALLDAMKASAKTEGFNLLAFGMGVLQGVLRPLLGIAFVLLYVDAKEIAADEPANAKDEG